MTINHSVRGKTQHMTSLEAQAHRLARQSIDKANQHYGTALPYPTLRFDLRGMTAGQAYSGRNLIRLNPLLLHENGEAFLQQTVPHEVAHLVADKLFGPGIRPHGREWQSVMAVLDASSERCHRFDTSRAAAYRQRRFSYACGCTRLHELSATRHNRIQRGAAYLCRRCGKKLRPAPAIQPNPA